MEDVAKLPERVGQAGSRYRETPLGYSNGTEEESHPLPKKKKGFAFIKTWVDRLETHEQPHGLIK